MNAHNNHYGITWELISDNPMLPKWTNRKRPFLYKVKHGIHTYLAIFAAIGIVGMIAIIYQIMMLLLNYAPFFTR